MNEIEQKLWCDSLLLAIGTINLNGDDAVAFASYAVKAFRRAKADLTDTGANDPS